MNPCGFFKLLPAMKTAAMRLGYALTLHGSMSRDYDLVAIAWVEGAADPDDVAMAIKEVAGAVRWRHFRSTGKPNGRLVYAFDWDKENFTNSKYCDLSVIPPTGWRCPIKSDN